MNRFLFPAILAVLFAIAPTPPAQAEVSVNLFYDTLTPYGSWVDVGDYGYCWQPRVAVSNTSWRPYSDGYWAYTDLGWTWVSYEDFGWATYHYGRWVRLRDRGWFWVPGREWAPAWVSWRTGGNYIGWAPLPPVSGREVVYEGRPIYGDVDIAYDIGPLYYNFVDVRYIGEPLLRERIYDPAQNVTFVEHTVNVTNITYNNSQVYNYGPDYNTVSAYSTRPIQRLTLQREATADPAVLASSPAALAQVRGDKLVVATPMRVEAPVQPVAPKMLKDKIAQPEVERGWSAVDPKLASRLKDKIKTEDPKQVPPPDITPRPGASAASAINASPAARPIAGTPATAAPSQPAAAPMLPAERGRSRNGRSSVPAAQPPVPSAAPVASPADVPARPKIPAERGRAHDRKNDVTPPVPPAIGTPTIPADDARPAGPVEEPRGRGRGRGAQPPLAPAAGENPAAPTERQPGRNNRRDDVPRDIQPVMPPQARGAIDEAPQPRGKRGQIAPPATEAPMVPPQTVVPPRHLPEHPEFAPAAPPRHSQEHPEFVPPPARPQQQVAPPPQRAVIPPVPDESGARRGKPEKAKKDGKPDEEPGQ